VRVEVLHVFQRHPFPVRARFRRCLVLGFALPEELLAPLLPAGLSIDAHEGHGFVAIALVATEKMRPLFVPRFLGKDFFLSGYRIFARYRTLEGRTLRGLRILRSDTDSRTLAFFGNRLTHYNYRPCKVRFEEAGGKLTVAIDTPDAEADLRVTARVDAAATALPDGSPFADLKTARRYAGPLPWTFDYEPETHSIIRIEGRRPQWDPVPVTVEVEQATFFDREPFQKARPVLANAFTVRDVPYEWGRGVREPLGRDA
jgi:hypothetical protein